MSKSMMSAAGGGKVTVSGLEAGKILQGTTVTVKQGSKTVANVAGSIPPYGPQTITPITRDQSFGPGVYLAGQINVKGDPNLVAANILKGKSIFGVAGALKPVFVFKSSGNQETSRTYQFVQNYAFVVIVGFYVDTGVTGFTVNTSGQLISTDAVGSTGQYVPKAESKVYANIKAGDTITMAASGPPAWGARLLIYGFG